MLINHFKSDKAYCINCTEYLNENTEKYIFIIVNIIPLNTTTPATTATDFTSTSNVTLTSSNTENEKIVSRYLNENTKEKYDYKVFTTKQPRAGKSS